MYLQGAGEVCGVQELRCRADEGRMRPVRLCGEKGSGREVSVRMLAGCVALAAHR